MIEVRSGEIFEKSGREKMKDREPGSGIVSFCDRVAARRNLCRSAHAFQSTSMDPSRRALPGAGLDPSVSVVTGL